METLVMATTSDKSMAGIQQLIDDFQRLLDDKENSDIVFLLGREEERIYAHKIILMARCKSFQTQKRGEICRIPGCSVSTTGNNLITVRLPHISAEVFRQFVLYVYTGKIIFQDSKIFEIMDLARDMGIDELRTACEDHVISTLSVENACIFLLAVIKEKNSASKSATSVMLEKIIHYIGENASECVKTNSFLNLTKEGLIKLISSDYFCMEEEDVWRSVLAWAKNQAGVTQPTAFWTEEERARVCQHLSGVMGYVRLLLIDSKVFASEVEPTGAVPIQLSLERYRYAALSSNKSGPQQIPTIPSLPGGPLTENDKRLQPRFMMNMFPGSVILKNDKLHLQGVLNGWYGSSKQSWRLVFRASVHNFSAELFHRYCDGISPCFVIAMGSRGEISGGFTDVPWAKINRKGGYIHSERAFLFALNSNNEPPTKYDIVKKPYAICYHPDCGPIFGAGADLFISNNCNSNMDSYSNLPHSYGNSSSCMSLFSDYNFIISDYEVYTLSTANGNSPNANVGIKLKYNRNQY